MGSLHLSPCSKKHSQTPARTAGLLTELQQYSRTYFNHLLIQRINSVFQTLAQIRLPLLYETVV